MKNANEDYVIDEKRKYEETKDPIYVWEAIHQLCLYYKAYDSDDPESELMDPPIFPEWIMNYLEEASRNLLKIDSPKDKARNEIKKALGFKNAKSFTKRNREKSEMDFDIWMEVQEERSKRKWGERGDAVFRAVLEKLRSKHPLCGDVFTVEDIYEAVNKILKEIKN